MSIHNKAEEALVINRESFEELYLRYWERLYVFCIKTTEDREMSREIVQDVFRSIWERRGELRLQDPERYLIRAIKMRTFEYIRNHTSRSRHHERILQQSDPQYTESHMDTKELLLLVKNLVGTLPEQCKRVFQLSREQGLSNREIADQLYISERAVEYHISRALKTLRTHLSDYIS